MVGIPEWVALGTFVLAALGELLHWRRWRRVRQLALGPAGRGWLVAPAAWTTVLALTVASWGFASLLWVVQPRVHNQQEIAEKDYKHLVLVVDVSPSMLLDDAGPEGDVSRRQRASDVLESMFNRMPMSQFKISLIGVYTDAKPLIEDSKDHEVVRHIMERMPLIHAYKSGKTDLLSGLQLAAEMVKPWNPGSTYVVMLSDGDTVPAQGMPRMPPSVAEVVVVGLGDSTTGKFIDGHQSRQDISTLRQIANRLRGTFHNGNQKHLPSQLVSRFTQQRDEDKREPWTRREWSLLAAVLGSATFALVPLGLHYLGTRYRPGTPGQPAE